jgi:hypothetical protein
MAGRIPRRTPEEEAAYEQRTRDGLALLERLHERVIAERAARARAEACRKRLRRIATLGLAR